MLQSTFSSKLLNLGTISSSNTPPGTICDHPNGCCSPQAGSHSLPLSLAPSPAPQQVHAPSLASLCGFLRQRRPLLASLNARPPQDLNRLPYVNLNSLRINTLVHAWLHVTHTQLGTGA